MWGTGDMMHACLSHDSMDSLGSGGDLFPKQRASLGSSRSSGGRKKESTPFTDLLQASVERIREEHEREVYLMRRAMEDAYREVDRLRLAQNRLVVSEHQSGHSSRSPSVGHSSRSPSARGGSAISKRGSAMSNANGKKMSGFRGSGISANSIFSALFRHSVHHTNDDTKSGSAGSQSREDRPSKRPSSSSPILNEDAANYIKETSQKAAKHLHLEPKDAASCQKVNTMLVPVMPQVHEAPAPLFRSSAPEVRQRGGTAGGADSKEEPQSPSSVSGADTRVHPGETSEKTSGPEGSSDSSESDDSDEDAPAEAKPPPAPPPSSPTAEVLPAPPEAPPPPLHVIEQPQASTQEPVANGTEESGHFMPPAPPPRISVIAEDSVAEQTMCKLASGASTCTLTKSTHMAAAQRSSAATNRASVSRSEDGPPVMPTLSHGSSCADDCSPLPTPRGSAETSLGALGAISEEFEHSEEDLRGSEQTRGSALSARSEHSSSQEVKTQTLSTGYLGKKSLPRLVGWQDKNTGSILKKSVTAPALKKKSTMKVSVLFAPETDAHEEEAEERERARKTAEAYDNLSMSVRPRWTQDDARRPPPNIPPGQSRASVWANMVDNTAGFGLQGSENIKKGRYSIDNLMSHPNSKYNFYVDILSFVFVGYDFVMVPLDVFDPDQSLFVEMMMVISTLWWTFDCLRHFSMGYYMHGEVVMSFWRIACRYLRTWFVVDIAIVTFDWIFQIMKYSEQGGATSQEADIVRSLRSLRGLRLLRGVKANRLLKIFEDRIHSESLSVIFTMTKLFSAILILNHIIACTWYWIGKTCKDGSLNNWVDQHLNDIARGQHFVYQYSTSFHWALTQFTPASISVQPYNFYERFFAIIVLLFALVTVSTFVSGITSAVMQLRSMRSAKSKQLWLLRRYLVQCNVPTALSVRINNYCDYAWGANEMRLQERNIQILTLLSQSLRSELKAAIFEPRIQKHPFFVLLGKVAPLTTRTLCSSAVSRIEVGRGDQLFAYGDTADQMYFLSKGELCYYHHDLVENAELLLIESWFCEPVLWTFWTYQGTLHAKTESVLSAVDAEKFGEIVQSNYDSTKEAAAYAKGFMQGLNRIDSMKLSDLYTTPLVEGLWFRLLNEFSFKRSTVKRSRYTKGSGQEEESSLFTKMYRSVVLRRFDDLHSFHGDE